MEHGFHGAFLETEEWAQAALFVGHPIIGHCITGQDRTLLSPVAQGGFSVHCHLHV